MLRVYNSHGRRALSFAEGVIESSGVDPYNPSLGRNESVLWFYLKDKSIMFVYESQIHQINGRVRVHFNPSSKEDFAIAKCIELLDSDEKILKGGCVFR